MPDGRAAPTPTTSTTRSAARPLEHLDDIVRNSAIYRRRHGALPMQRLARRVRRRRLGRADGDGVPGPRRRPAGADRARPPPLPRRRAARRPSRRVDPDRVAGWEPDPLLEPRPRSRPPPTGIDVVHVHFGYDHLSAGRAGRLAGRRRGAGDRRSCVTVHDLRNPHHADPARHDAHLRRCWPPPTPCSPSPTRAADECERRYGRRPEVVPHPPLVAGAPPRPRRDRAARGPAPAEEPAAQRRRPGRARRAPRPDAGAASGGRLRVLVDPRAWDAPRCSRCTRWPASARTRSSVDVRPYLPHDRLSSCWPRAHACVLPYRFGTHSGWLELGRDLGVHVVAPDCGHYAAQWPHVLTYGNNERTAWTRASLRAAVARRLPQPRRRAAGGRREREALRRPRSAPGTTRCTGSWSAGDRVRCIWSSGPDEHGVVRHGVPGRRGLRPPGAAVRRTWTSCATCPRATSCTCPSPTGCSAPRVEAAPAPRSSGSPRWWRPPAPRCR